VVVLTYSQATGEMRDASGNLLGMGYAGHGPGLNNPAMQEIHNVGPLPRGAYEISPPVDTATHGPFVMWLTPDPANEMFGRFGFGIHADKVANPGKRLASTGCIVLSRDVREAVWAAAQKDGRSLQVVA
jgi:hypothetical protein